MGDAKQTGIGAGDPASRASDVHGSRRSRLRGHELQAWLLSEHLVGAVPGASRP